jgi:hypothetical protein
MCIMALFTLGYGINLNVYQQMNLKSGTYTQWVYLFSYKKHEILSFSTI